MIGPSADPGGVAYVAKTTASKRQRDAYYHRINELETDVTGYRFTGKYLFIGNRLEGVEDMWLEVGHNQATPPVVMTLVASAVLASTSESAGILRNGLPEVRHAYYRQHLGRKERGQPKQERYVYLHESIGGAKGQIPLSDELAKALWDEIMAEEAKK